MRYFKWNKKESPGSEWICAPTRLLKCSLITTFYPKVIEECVPKWITLPLSFSLLFFFSLFPSFFLSCFSCPLSFFLSFIHPPSPSLCTPFNGLHMLAEWQQGCCDKVKMPQCGCPSVDAPVPCSSPPGRSVLCLQYTAPALRQPHLSKPQYQGPHSSAIQPRLCYLPPFYQGRSDRGCGRKKKTDTLVVLTLLNNC